jgi:aerobic-type carbon monoxide dehydrogenase small subunit (CoxS/CutS family)
VAVSEQRERVDATTPGGQTELTVSFVLNGRPVRCHISTSATLADVLRLQLGLTGTKIGCAAGVCGACSVMIDAELMSSCIFPAVAVEGRSVVTIEGIADEGGGLNALQDAFITEGGFQCGICTPGQIVAATALLDRNPDPGEDDIKEWLKGNLCRCTGYFGIIRAVRRAAGQGRCAQ